MIQDSRASATCGQKQGLTIPKILWENTAAAKVLAGVSSAAIIVPHHRPPGWLLSAPRARSPKLHPMDVLVLATPSPRPSLITLTCNQLKVVDAFSSVKV
ncbi:hypothetical protein MHYP_G00007860 [Metynnis hypsauchen]